VDSVPRQFEKNASPLSLPQLVVNFIGRRETSWRLRCLVIATRRLVYIDRRGDVVGLQKKKRYRTARSRSGHIIDNLDVFFVTFLCSGDELCQLWRRSLPSLRRHFDDEDDIDNNVQAAASSSSPTTGGAFAVETQFVAAVGL
jgi:hypothetical protein